MTPRRPSSSSAQILLILKHDSCGSSMTQPIQVEGEQADGVFLSCRTSFIITDDLKVALNSMRLVLNVLNDLGYTGFDKLKEMLVHVGFEEVVTLLGYLFTSEAPLTDSLLRKHSIARKRKMLRPLLPKFGVAEVADKLLHLKVYVQKSDRAILYAECREDFVDFLFTFLAIPLEFAWELSIDNVNMGCVANLCKSVKDLSFEKQEEASNRVLKCMLPSDYNCRAQLLDVAFEEMPEYECLVDTYCYSSSKLTKKIQNNVLADGERIVKLISVDSKSMVTSDGTGLVKGETHFIVSDDLVVTPMNSSSTISLLSKLKMSISDIEEQVISIGKAEATSLLRASLITTSALTNGLSNFLSKMNPKEATPSTSKMPKSEKTL